MIFPLKKQAGLLMGVTLCLLASSCERPTTVDSSSPQPNQPGVITDAASSDMEQFAMNLAVSLQDRNVRNLIKAEAMKQFDGDYDVLVRELLNKQVGNGKTFADKIAPPQVSPNERVATLSDNTPLLNIGVPVNVEKWNAADVEPLVALIPVSEKAEKIKAFDSKGKVHWLDGRVAPDFPVIAVGLNERVTFQNGSFSVKKGLQDAGKTTASNTKQSNARVSCTRSSNSWEALKRLYSPDIGAIESWIRGRPELILKIFANTGGFANVTAGQVYQGYWSPTRGAISGGIDLNDYLLTWDWDGSYGEILTYNWIEEDSQGSWVNRNIKVKMKVAGQDIDVDIPLGMWNEDILIHTTHVYKDHRYTQEYGNYSLYFRIN